MAIPVNVDTYITYKARRSAGLSDESKRLGWSMLSGFHNKQDTVDDPLRQHQVLIGRSIMEADPSTDQLPKETSS